MFGQIVEAASLVFQWQNVILLAMGITLGIMIGAIPGLTVHVAVIMLLPMVFYLSPIVGIALIIGAYKGGTYGGSISSILLNTPGTPAAAATALDGYPLAKKGKAKKALKMAIYASVLADTFSDIVLILVAAQLAKIALMFGPPEYFSLLIFAISIVSLVSGKSLLKGWIAAAIGLILATVGMDAMTGALRFNFGILELSGGIHLVPLIIGLFAISEILIQTEKLVKETVFQSTIPESKNPEDNRVSWVEFKKCSKTIFRSACIGTGIGALPGLGSAVSAFTCYGVAKGSSDHPERFGKGELEGVAAAEAGNNAVCGATLIPLLTFGIPGDVITAIMLGAFIIQGINPGPLVFKTQPIFIYGIYISMLLANVLNFFIANFGLRLFAKVVKAPKALLYPIVLILCFVGVYITNASMFDLKILIMSGILGYLMRKFEFPLAPLLITFILEPMIETSLRQSLIMSGGSVSIFFTRPISLAFLIITVIFVAFMGFKYKVYLKG